MIRDESGLHDKQNRQNIAQANVIMGGAGNILKNLKFFTIEPRR
jgi:hypothetical protein